LFSEFRSMPGIKKYNQMNLTEKFIIFIFLDF